MANKRCIITGNDHYNTLNVVRALGEADIYVILILIKDKKKHFAGHSKYVNELYELSSEEECIKILNSIAESYPDENLPVIYTYDTVATYIDNHLEELNSRLITPSVGHTAGKLGNLMDKELQLKFAESSGFLIPKSQKLSETDSAQLCFPVIIKPEKSIIASKDSFCICHNRREFDEALKSHDYDPDNTLVQDYIENHEMYEVVGVRKENGEVYIGGTLEKIKFGYKSNTLGLNVLSRIISEPILEEKCRKFVEQADFYGIFAVEVVVPQTADAQNRKYYFLEINLRSDAAMFVYNAAGINYPAVWANPEYYYSSKDAKIKSVVGMNEFHYLRHFVTPRKLPAVLKDFAGTSTFAIFSLKDFSPFFYKIFSAF